MSLVVVMFAATLPIHLLVWLALGARWSAPLWAVLCGLIIPLGVSGFMYAVLRIAGVA